MLHTQTRGSAAAVSHPVGLSDRPSRNPLLKRPTGNLYDAQLKQDVEKGYETFWERRGIVHPNPERERAFVGFNKSLL